MPPVKKTLAEEQQRQLVMSRNHRQPWNASSLPPVLHSSPNQFRSLYTLIPSTLCVGLGHLISDNKEAQERLGLCNDYTLHLRVTVKRNTSVHNDDGSRASATATKNSIAWSCAHFRIGADVGYRFCVVV
ncbi:uncharacterized protein K489DRAFT_377042 [Dissoconium aciculare CBS 342.82]|uniref:Uncharacterized protein n=1 Tax=Dissoconium aciculare CBS 342.82 TaxID=1314786 RepID=A0A6J3MI81_9PEZI|nr:uncharacterized protein K489DRAFT_377042 [Dissoconium aciculare CBS 342.82]KAF1826612.1 hypothetical protein K489DRAFT_377042 [Dissoconium aciculare CBS 342.82]